MRRLGAVYDLYPGTYFATASETEICSRRSSATRCLLRDSMGSSIVPTRKPENPRIRYAASLPRLWHDRTAGQATRGLALPIRSAQTPAVFPAEDYG